MPAPGSEAALAWTLAMLRARPATSPRGYGMTALAMEAGLGRRRADEVGHDIAALRERGLVSRYTLRPTEVGLGAMVPDIRAIAAVGRQGQVGLAGHLPWHDPADLKAFKAATLGCRVVVGARTAAGLPPLPGRHVHVMARHETPGSLLWEWIEDLGTLYIAGGPTIYALWQPHVRQTIITHIAYDGPADAYAPPGWPCRTE